MWNEWTYLIAELGWALPVLLLQWWRGAALLRRGWRPCLAVVAGLTVWLCLADTVAIGLGVWTINPALTTGVKIGPLPLEEAIFFLLSTTIVAQSYVMLRGAPHPFRRPAGTRAGREVDRVREGTA